MSQVSVVLPTPTRKRTRTASSTGRVVKKKRSPYDRIPKAMIGKGFPEKITCALRYFDYKTPTAASNALAFYHYKANGLYDPDTTGIGHQPLGFDQFTPIYNHYVVLGARIKATFTYRDEVGDVVHPIMCGIYDDDDGSNSLTYSSIVEGGDRRKYNFLTSNNDKLEVYSKWTSTRTFGNAPVSDPSQRGSASADPSETHQWCIWYYNLGNSSHVINVAVDIEYSVVWFEKKDLAGS